MTLASAWQTRANWNWNLLSELVSSSVRRTLRMTSGLILFTYIGAHLTNHALGLISLDTAERGMEIAVEVWYSVPGTLLLYGAAATHFVLALWAVYERRTFRLPQTGSHEMRVSGMAHESGFGCAAQSRPISRSTNQPTKFELVVNLQLAKAIGHEVAAGLLLRAR